MTRFEFFQIAQTIVMVVASLLMASVSFGKWSARIDHTKDILDLKSRLDDAGQRMSDLTDDVQAMPDRLRLEFISRELFVQEQGNAREERSRMQREIDRLWGEIRTRKQQRND